MRPTGRRPTDVLGLGPREPGAPCPISPVYEVVRHAAALRALAGDRPAVLALVYDSDNPYFAPTGEWPGWPALLDEAVGADERFRFAAISWQELMRAAAARRADARLGRREARPRLSQ